MSPRVLEWAPFIMANKHIFFKICEGGSQLYQKTLSRLELYTENRPMANAANLFHLLKPNPSLNTLFSCSLQNAGDWCYFEHYVQAQLWQKSCLVCRGSHFCICFSVMNRVCSKGQRKHRCEGLWIRCQRVAKGCHEQIHGEVQLTQWLILEWDSWNIRPFVFKIYWTRVLSFVPKQKDLVLN